MEFKLGLILNCTVIIGYVSNDTGYEKPRMPEDGNKGRYYGDISNSLTFSGLVSPNTAKWKATVRKKFSIANNVHK